ncbi:MAG: RNase P modulator RnpM [Anaerolineae bacterium]
MARKKHVPQRTCIACRAVKDKRELVRIVRVPSGEVLVDETGKLNGRGAYLCRQESCWERGLQDRRLARALKTEITEETRRALGTQAADLLRLVT